MNACLAYRSDPRLSIKSINDNAPHVPKRQKRALGRRKGPGTRGGPDLTSHDESPRTSKPSSPSGELDTRVLRGYCRAKDSGNLGPFHIKPKSHVEEEEMSENEQRRSEPPRDVGKDNFFLGKLKSRKKKVARHQGQFPRASKRKAQVQRDIYKRIVEEQF